MLFYISKEFLQHFPFEPIVQRPQVAWHLLHSGILKPSAHFLPLSALLTQSLECTLDTIALLAENTSRKRLCSSLATFHILCLALMSLPLYKCKIMTGQRLSFPQKGREYFHYLLSPSYLFTCTFQLKPLIFFFFKSSKNILFIFREGEGREKEGEKHECVIASHTATTEDLACNWDMCSDWELNWWPFGSQAGTQSSKPH